MNLEKMLNKDVNSNDIILAYDPTKFFWASADQNDIDIAYCNLSQCSNTTDCYKKELCNNKSNYELLRKIQSNHSSSDGRFVDTSNLYKRTLLETLNLGGGIIVMGILLSTLYSQ